MTTTKTKTPESLATMAESEQTTALSHHTGLDDAISKSGFVSIVGRPNAGKSTLLNQIVGEKVSITSDKAQTTRTQVRGVFTRDETQIVFVDTPGIGKPRTALGTRLNQSAYEAFSGVDQVVFVLDATKPFGKGDGHIAGMLGSSAIAVVSKIDKAEPKQVLEQLAALGELDFADYFPISGRTGEGVDELLDYLVSKMPEGPAFYPSGQITDTDENAWIAELVREQLLAVTHDELPHSVATRVTEVEGPRVRVEILVERESQKGIVIGKGGAVLKEVGTRVRAQLDSGMFLELFVKVEKDWQRHNRALDELGY